MTPEEIQAAIAAGITAAMKTVTDQMTALGTTVAGIKTASADDAAKKIAADAAAKKLADEEALKNGKQKTPEENAEIAAMKRLMDASNKKIADLETANKTAQDAVMAEKQRTAVGTALDGFNFASPDAKQTAFEMLNSKVKRNEDGALIAGDNLPVDAFAKEFIPTHSYLLAAEVRGGSGATNKHSGGKVATMESIKDGMSAEEVAAASSAILSVINSL